MALTSEITGKTTMKDVLQAYPAARRALFQKYHIGGCSSCGFSPEDALEDVLASHGIDEVDETIQYIRESQRADDAIKIRPVELHKALASGQNLKLIDVRDRWEFDIAHLEQASLLDRALVQEMLDHWPRGTPIVFVCHHGSRSLDAASYFREHGFSDVRSLEGGVDAWAVEVQPEMARY